jgi:sialate O-acetylesterase
MALSEPRTAMAVAIDLGEEKNIHPIRKAPLGERLALTVRAVALGDKIPYSGPVYRDHTVEGHRIRIRFDHTQGGLATADGRAPIGFAVSGGATDFSKDNRGFVWADAIIQGEELVVESPQVPRPVAVRYAWAQNPDCNLMNLAGLWAVPFRTDDWPGVTVNNW